MDKALSGRPVTPRRPAAIRLLHSLATTAVFACANMRQPTRLNFLWESLCLAGSCLLHFSLVTHSTTEEDHASAKA